MAPKDEAIKDSIREMLGVPRPDHGMIVQALFYLCDPIYDAVGGVPTVDFAWVRPANGWVIQFGRQEPGPENVRMIESVKGE